MIAVVLAWHAAGCAVGPAGSAVRCGCLCLVIWLAVICEGDLVPGETIRWQDLDIRVLHTPGHTPGSVCLLVGPDLAFGLGQTAGGNTARKDFSSKIKKGGHGPVLTEESAYPF